jgi:hypothetical protein
MGSCTATMTEGFGAWPFLSLVKEAWEEIVMLLVKGNQRVMVTQEYKPRVITKTTNKLRCQCPWSKLSAAQIIRLLTASTWAELASFRASQTHTGRESEILKIRCMDGVFGFKSLGIAAFEVMTEFSF